MKINRIAFALLTILSTGLLSAQTCGNPAGAAGKGLWTMALSGAFQTLDEGTQTAETRRVLFKTQYGLGAGLDAYGLIGAVDLAMKHNSPGFSVSNDKYRIAYGAGFSFQMPAQGAKPAPKSRVRNPRSSRNTNPLVIFGGGNVIRFPSEAVYTKPGDYWTQEFSLKYDSREATGHAGILLPGKTLKFYIGGAVWAVQRLDSKKQTLLASDGSETVVGTKKGKYQSGVWTGGMVGVQYDLPQNVSLSVEGVAFNQEYYRIMIGISQTGIRPW
ncbi:MAG: hypothetical protein QUS35_03235 [bacterium]|nr:hypothetical protein [bacterium]